LVVQTRRSRFSTTTSFWNDLANARGSVSFTHTVRRKLHKGTLRSRRPCIRIPLTHRHHQARFKWTMEHTRWTMQHWRQVLFSEETMFHIDFR
jgi:hypothetical protein